MIAPPPPPVPLERFLTGSPCPIMAAGPEKQTKGPGALGEEGVQAVLHLVDAVGNNKGSIAAAIDTFC